MRKSNSQNKHFRSVRTSELNYWMSAAAICILAFYPSSAFAHIKGGEVIGFISGLQHPISGLDHVLAMIAVGLWGAQLGAPAVWLLPVTFPMVMAFGGLLGLLGVNLPGIEIGIAVSAIALGFAVFREARLKLWMAAVLVGFFAIFHGYAHGAELPPGGNGLLYSIGFVVMTGCLHATGIAMGLIHQWSAGRAALRAAGVCVSLAGVFFLWRALV
jgi:urease accessory protein